MLLGACNQKNSADGKAVTAIRSRYGDEYPFAGFIDYTVDQSKPRNIQLDEVAKIIDRGIHSSYRIYTSNRIALDLLSGGSSQQQYYTDEDRKTFENYLNKQLSNIDIPNPDWDFLRRKILEMYANPLINQLKASGISQELV